MSVHTSPAIRLFGCCDSKMNPTHTKQIAECQNSVPPEKHKEPRKTKQQSNHTQQKKENGTHLQRLRQPLRTRIAHPAEAQIQRCNLAGRVLATSQHIAAQHPNTRQTRSADARTEGAKQPEQDKRTTQPTQGATHQCKQSKQSDQQINKKTQTQHKPTTHPKARRKTSGQRGTSRTNTQAQTALNAGRRPHKHTPNSRDRSSKHTPTGTRTCSASDNHFAPTSPIQLRLKQREVNVLPECWPRHTARETTEQGRR